MKRIAVENSIIVLEAKGSWVWENGQATTEVKVPRGDAQRFTVNGVPALLEGSIVDAIKEQISRNKYCHVPAATKPGGIASVEVTVENSSLSSKLFYQGHPLATSDTLGTFTLSAADRSQTSPQDIDPIGVHSGSWHIKETSQEVCLETDDKWQSSRSPVDRNALISDTSQAAISDDQKMKIEGRLHFWIKAFIPDPDQVRWKKNPYTKKKGNEWVFDPLSEKNPFTKTKEGKWVVKPPLPDAAIFDRSLSWCFETDNRGFLPDPKAPAKVTSEFVFVIRDGDASIEKAGGRDMLRAGQSKAVYCNTGTIARNPRPGKVESDLEELKITTQDNLKVLNFEVEARNPHFMIAPIVNYGVTLSYDVKRKKVHIKVKGQVFPAFEAYYQWNDGPVKKFLEAVPIGTPAHLIDLGLPIIVSSAKVKSSFQIPVKGSARSSVIPLLSDSSSEGECEIIGATCKTPTGRRAKLSDLLGMFRHRLRRRGIWSTSQRPQSSDNKVSLAIYKQTCPVGPCRDRTPVRGKVWNQVGSISTGAAT